MKIALLGDIALIGRYDRTIDNKVDQRVQFIKELVQDCDYVIANQESVFTDTTKTLQCKGVYLRSASENVKTLKYMGVTHVTLANNHIFDYGTKGMRDTCRTLKNAGIEYVGLCGKPAILEKDNSRVMLDGFCCLSANAIRYGNHRGHVHLLTDKAVDSFLRKAEKKNCLPIVSAHFGVEGVHYPVTEHIEMFRGFARNYNYVLHGNHPHAMQGIEQVNDSLLVYAQGNLCFDRCTVTSIHEVNEESTESRKGYVVLLEIENNKIVKHEVVSVTDNDSGIIHENKAGYDEIAEYSDALSQQIDKITELRNAELKKMSENRAKRGLVFYAHRMNPKYIGAFINGKNHARKYNKLFSANTDITDINEKRQFVPGRISILMSVYNCEDTLRESIDSILKQTYTDWVFIICNDCSTDGTLNILREYEKQYPSKFVIIENDKNMRLAYSLNHCLQYADGEFCARMDGDDYCAPDRFEKQVRYLNNHPDIQLVGTWMQKFDGDELGGYVKYKEVPDETDLRYGPIFAHASILARTDSILDTGGYTVSRRTMRTQDYDLWFRYYAHGYKGQNIQEALYFVREDAKAFMRRKPKLYLWAVVTRFKGFRLLHYPLKFYPRVLSPIPSLFYNELRKARARFIK